MQKFKFTVKIDEGAQGVNLLDMVATGKDLEEAQEKIFESLRHEYRNVVAFFEIADWKRL